MNKPLHTQAFQQTQHFFELMWDELPTSWHTDIRFCQVEFELWLATFDLKREQEQLTGHQLLAAVRKRAERYYQQDLKQPHHTLIEWAFFRFRLELALLKTCSVNLDTLDHCYTYSDLLANYAFSSLIDSRKPFN